MKTEGMEAQGVLQTDSRLSWERRGPVLRLAGWEEQAGAGKVCHSHCGGKGRFTEKGKDCHAATSF